MEQHSHNWRGLRFEDESRFLSVSPLVAIRWLVACEGFAAATRPLIPRCVRSAIFSFPEASVSSSIVRRGHGLGWHVAFCRSGTEGDTEKGCDQRPFSCLSYDLLFAYFST